MFVYICSMKKYLQKFKESCVNYHNIRSFIVVMIIVLFLTDNWITTILGGVFYIVTLIACWEVLKYLKKE